MSSSSSSTKALPSSLDAKEAVKEVKSGGIQPLRRSRRERNRIPISSLHRFWSLFWNGDDRYDKKKHRQDESADDDEDESTDDVVFELSLVAPKKRPRIESVEICQHQEEDLHSSVDLLSSITSIVTPSPIEPLSQSSNNSEQHHHQQQQQQQFCPQRWWPKRLNLRKANHSPHIYIVENFLTTHQLAYLHQQIQHREDLLKGQPPPLQRGSNKDGWQRSFCDTDQGTIIIDDQHRTSSFLSLPKQSDKTIRDIERAAADLMGVHVQQVEALQLVRYRPGEFFGLHHDLGELVVNDSDDEHDPTHDTFTAASVLLPPKSIYGIPRRVATLFCYLNTLPPQCGGATYFPLCDGLQVQPEAGRAVLFCNITPEGLPEPKTIHAGQPVFVVPTDADLPPTSCTLDDSNKTTVHGDSSFNDNGISTVGSHPQHDQQPPAKALVVKYGLNIWACEG